MIMELHQRLTHLVQKETDRLLKDFLNDNPDLLQRYVDGGVTAVGLILTPLNAFMRHLLVVRGLDPDTEPGERQRRELHEAVGSLFNVTHEKDFDEDYDFSWVHKKFEEARKSLGHLSLTKDRFKQLTDLDKLPNIGYGRYPTVEEEQEYFSTAPSGRLPDKEIPVTPVDELDLNTKEGRQQFRDRALSEFEHNPIDSLRNALKEIVKQTAEKAAVSDKFNPGEAIKKVEGIFEEISKSVPKKGIKVSKKKSNKGPDPKGPPAWGSKGVKVNRVPPTTTELEEHKATKSTLKEKLRVKHDRAKQLTNDMVARGLVTDNKEAISAQLQEILLMHDDAVDALARVVGKHTKSPSDDKFKGSFRRVQK
jgi:hypothetical protein